MVDLDEPLTHAPLNPTYYYYQDNNARALCRACAE